MAFASRFAQLTLIFCQYQPRLKLATETALRIHEGWPRPRPCCAVLSTLGVPRPSDVCNSHARHYAAKPQRLKALHTVPGVKHWRRAGAALPPAAHTRYPPALVRLECCNHEYLQPCELYKPHSQNNWRLRLGHNTSESGNAVPTNGPCQLPQGTPESASGAALRSHNWIGKQVLHSCLRCLQIGWQFCISKSREVSEVAVQHSREQAKRRVPRQSRQEQQKGRGETL